MSQSSAAPLKAAGVNALHSVDPATHTCTKTRGFVVVRTSSKRARSNRNTGAVLPICIPPRKPGAAFVCSTIPNPGVTHPLNLPSTGRTPTRPCPSGSFPLNLRLTPCSATASSPASPVATQASADAPSHSPPPPALAMQGGPPDARQGAPSGSPTAGSDSGAATAAPPDYGGPGSEFIRAHLRKLKAYTPIEPFEVLSKKMGRDPKDIVKLDANENPYGPPPEVLAALGSMEYPHIYPDPECRQLRALLAKDTGVPMEHILVGCGADELIDLLMRCTLEVGDCILDCPPTFTMYAFDADVNGARVIAVPRRPEDFSVDLPAVKAAVALHKPKIIFLTSPNNPDGSVLADWELEEVLECRPKEMLVVLDEAYVEFSGLPSKMPWVCRYPNLVVLRTFSKRAALAGLRVGYGAFPLGLAEYLWRAKQPYNVSVAAQAAACAALSNPAYLESVRDALVSERGRLMHLLESEPLLSFLSPFPSNSNFILCSVLPPWNALPLKNALADEGVMVRHYNKPELKNFIRISVGKPEQTDALMKALLRVASSCPA